MAEGENCFTVAEGRQEPESVVEASTREERGEEQEEPSIYHGDEAVKYLNDESGARAHGDDKTRADTYSVSTGVAIEAEHGPSIRGFGETGGQEPTCSPGPLESPGIAEQIGARSTSSVIHFQPPTATIEFRPVADVVPATESPTSAASLGGRILGRLPKSLKWKSSHRDDVAITINEEEPGMQGNRVNFISQFAITQQQASVKKERGTNFTIIRSISGSNTHGGVRMEQAMNAEWNYFEVIITHTVEAGEIGMGVGHKNYPLCRMPGWGDGSIGYHANDDGLFHEDGFPQLHGPPCRIGDKIGCGVDFTPKADGHIRVWFTKNDQVVISPQTVELPVDSKSKLYPLLCMKKGQEIRYLGHWWKPPPTENVDVDIAIAISEKQPAMQGDRINFISQFGTTEQQVTVMKERGTEYTMIRSISGAKSISGVRMEQAMNQEWNYFEVTITHAVGNGEIGIGLGHKNYNLSKMPGWDDGSIGYHADDGGLFHEDGFPLLHGPPCRIGDKIGCGVDFTRMADGHVRVWFNKNDHMVIKPQNVNLPVNSKSKLYPLIGMKWAGQEVRYLGHSKKAPPAEDVGDKMNFISQFGTTQQQASLRKERGTEFTIIRSQYGSNRHCGIRMQQAMSLEWNYFELTITDTFGDGEIGIGVGHKNYPLSRMPGLDDDSIGYHADDGGLYNEYDSSVLQGPTCKIGDRMGCGVDFTLGTDGLARVWFTKNDEVVINPQTVKVPFDSDSELYPLICMEESGQEVRYMGHWQKTPPSEIVGCTSPSGRHSRLSRNKPKSAHGGDNVNFIARFGIIKQHVTLTAEEEITMLCSCNEKNGIASIRMKQEMIPKCNYFEVTITDTVEAGEIGIGIGHKHYPLSKLPGWGNRSIGYHADDGGLYHEHESPKVLGPPCIKGDRMGCGVDFTPSKDGHVRVWFTKNDRVVFYPQTVDLPVSAESKFYPLIGMQGSGQKVQYNGHWQKTLPKKVAPILWWRAAGFQSVKEVPFYTKEVTTQKYGKWDPTPDSEVDFLQFHRSYSKQFRDAKSFSECMKKAEALIQENPIYEADFKELKAPNGKELETSDRVILFFAKMLISAVGKDDAIPFFMYIGGLNNTIMNMTMVGALLYMGCATDFFLQGIAAYLNVFLNWEIDSNLQDRDGITALHIYQTNLGSVKMLVDYKADVNVQDNSGDTPLHIAARNGRTAVAEMLLQHHALTSIVNNKNETALDTAAVHRNLECFKTIFTYATMGERNKYRCSSQKWKRECQNLLSKAGQAQHEGIEELSQVQIYCATVRKRDQESSVQQAGATDQDQVTSVQRLVSEAAKCDIDLSPQLLTEIFNACIFGDVLVITDILEADRNGNLPGIHTNKEFSDGQESEEEQQQETSLLPYLRDRPKLFFKLAKHPTLKTFVEVEWWKHARHVFRFRLLYYLFKIVVLTFALASAAQPNRTDDQLNTYLDSMDYIRCSCELLLLLMTMLKIVEEAAEILVSRWSYLKDRTNYIEWLGVLFILLIIPFRVSNHPGQWIVASLAYFLNALNIIEFIALFQWTGVYLQTLRIIISRDIVRFLIVFHIMLVIFSGSLYLSLRYHDSIITLNGSNITSPGGGINADLQSLDGVGKLLHELYFSGIRALIEAGSVLDYYGPNGSFRAWSVIIYLLFLFIVIIVLLNVLIAQVSDTYSKVLSTAERVYLYHQCRYLAKLEAQHFAACLLYDIFKQCFCRRHGSHSQMFMCLNISSKRRQWPNVIWIGKKRSQGKSQWEALKRIIVSFFTDYHGDDVVEFLDDDSDDSVGDGQTRTDTFAACEGTASLGERILGRLPKRFKLKTPHSGDRVNLISQFGTTAQQMAVKEEKGTEFTMIRSQYGSSNHSGVRMNQAMNQERNYFEVAITRTVGDGEIGIGVGHKNYSLFRMPGWDDGSIGYHADDGGLFHGFGFPLMHGPPCSKGDRMGCGVDFTSSAIGHVLVWFTKNDQVVMKPQKMEIPVDSKSKLYPLIGMKWSGQEVRYLGHCKKPLPVEDVGDRVNFISESGATEQQVTVSRQTGTKFTIIRSRYGSNGHGGVRMKRAMNQEWNYFEVTITDSIGDGEIGIGVGHKNYPLSEMPGWHYSSIGYHADDGGLYHDNGTTLLHGPTCTIGDRMGCGVDFTPREDGLVRVWFTKNDQMVINPQTLKLPADPESELYPLICMEESGQEVRYLGHWQEISPTETGCCVGMPVLPQSPTVESAGHVHPVPNTTGLTTLRGKYSKLLKKAKSLHGGESMNLIKRFGTTEQDVTVATGEEVTLLESCSRNNGIASLRMKQEMSEKWNYFEVTIINTVEAGEIGIGIGHKNYPLSKMPGWGNRSIGYHADDGGLYHEHGSAQVHGSTCKKGDRMGCGVDFTPSGDGHVRVWFTKNEHEVFTPQTVELPVSSASKFYPLIGMRGSGQKVQYNGHWQKTPPKKVVSIPWWRAAGFKSEKEVPFYMKEATVDKFGKWESTPDFEVDLSDFIQFHRSCLKQFRDTKSASECMEKAEAFIRKYAEYEADFDELKAPNGKELEASDHVTLFFARMLISAVGSDEAFPFFMSLGGLNNTIMNMAMVGALLYMGCTTDHFLIHSSYMNVFLNWEANPDIQDRDGKTALHLHQTNLGSVKMLLDFKAKVDLQDNSGDTPLHVAARNGRTAVAELLLQHHASTSKVNSKNETALDTAAVHGNLECFKAIFTCATMCERDIYRSGSQEWKKACQKLASKEGHVQHEKLEGLSQVQIYCATVSKTDQDRKASMLQPTAADQNRVTSVQRLVSEAAKCDIDLTPQLLTKIFNACIFGHKLVITDILEADLDGNLPNTVISTDEESTDGQENEEDVQQETSLLPYLSDRPKLFFKLAKHPTLKTFVKVQWRKQALHVFWSRFLYYLFKMVVLTFALVIAARPELTDDQINKYPDPLDYFRGICEVLVLLTTLVKIAEEAAEIAVSRRSYFKDWTNYLEWLYVLFILLIIPFRASNNPGQWIVASLAYCLSGLKIIEFIALFQWSGAYLQTLRIIITRDIVRFMTVFLILLVIFSGGLYLSLRYDGTLVKSPDTNTTSFGGGMDSALHSLDGEGRLLHELYFTGLRALIEAGNVLNYYGPNSSFRPMSVIIYLLFLFIVVIVLLNVLIAQVSDTYGKVLSTAEGVYLYHQCRYIARLEAQHFAPCLLYDIVKRCCCRYHGTRSQGCMCLTFSSKQRQWPNVIWIGKKRSQGIVQWEALMKKVANFFEIYSFDEDDDLSLTEVEEDTQKLEKRTELEHKWFEDQMDKMEVVLADKTSSLTQKLKQKIEEEVGGLAERLTNKLPENYHGGSCPVRRDGHEESRYQESTAIALHVSSMRNLEEEVKKLASQLQEVKSLLLKEQPNYPHSPSTQEPSDPVSGGEHGENAERES